MPTLYTGFSDVIGSWKIIAISLPRKRRSSASLFVSRSSRRYSTLPSNFVFTLRVNLLVTYVVSDALRAVTAVADYTQALYREAQLVLRAAVGTKTLDALLADKESVGAEVREALTARAAVIGVTVRSVGLRDIVLPGDMKQLLNQVIAASKEAEANLIKRREETAAARSQANTAKLLAESPQLARLKELELLKDVLAGSKTTFVFGGGDIADQVRGLVAKDEA